MNETTPRRSGRRLAVAVSGALILLLLILWQSGAFRTGRVEPGTTAMPPQAPARGTVHKVTTVQVPLVYKAVGTVRSRDQIEVSPRIVARIVDVKVRSGDAVKKDDVLITMDSADLEAAVAQARARVQAAEETSRSAGAGIEGAQAAHDLARTEEARARELLAQKSAAAELARLRQTERAALAEVAAVQQVLKQTEAGLSYATIRSPMDGLVAERFVDPGDLASPGNILLRVFDPTRLMLEVPVREALISVVKIDARVPVLLPALGKSVETEVREIVPSVDPASRTFLVKLCMGEDREVVPGTFGTLSLVIGSEEALLVPAAAVRRAGQLESVQIVSDERVTRRFVRTAPESKDMLRVLSGLQAGEEILLPES